MEAACMRSKRLAFARICAAGIFALLAVAGCAKPIEPRLEAPEADALTGRDADRYGGYVPQFPTIDEVEITVRRHDLRVEVAYTPPDGASEVNWVPFDAESFAFRLFIDPDQDPDPCGATENAEIELRSYNGELAIVLVDGRVQGTIPIRDKAQQLKMLLPKEYLGGDEGLVAWAFELHSGSYFGPYYFQPLSVLEGSNNPATGCKRSRVPVLENIAINLQGERLTFKCNPRDRSHDYQTFFNNQVPGGWSFYLLLDSDPGSGYSGRYEIDIHGIRYAEGDSIVVRDRRVDGRPIVWTGALRVGSGSMAFDVPLARIGGTTESIGWVLKTNLTTLGGPDGTRITSSTVDRYEGVATSKRSGRIHSDG